MEEKGKKISVSELTGDLLRLIAQVRREHKARREFRNGKNTDRYNKMAEEEHMTCNMADELSKKWRPTTTKKEHSK